VFKTIVWFVVVTSFIHVLSVTSWQVSVPYLFLKLSTFSQFLVSLFKQRRVMEKHRVVLRQCGVGLHGVLWQVKDAESHPPLCRLVVDIITHFGKFDYSNSFVSGKVV